MKETLLSIAKRSKFVLCIALFVEAATLFFFFLVKCFSKKDLKEALLATSFLAGAMGTALLVQMLWERNQELETEATLAAVSDDTEEEPVQE